MQDRSKANRICPKPGAAYAPVHVDETRPGAAEERKIMYSFLNYKTNKKKRF